MKNIIGGGASIVGEQWTISSIRRRESSFRKCRDVGRIMDMLGRSARRSSFVGWDDDAPRFDETRR